MRAFLVSLMNYDHPDIDVEEWQPANARSFVAEMVAYVSDSPDGDSDAFDFTVCTPDRLHSVVSELESDHPVKSLHGVIVIPEWSSAQLRAQLERWCSDAEGPTWNAVASLLHRYLRWEFDYRLSRDSASSPPRDP